MYKRYTQADAKILTVAEAAYLSGFIDGEGSLMINKRRRVWKDGTIRGHYFRPVISVAQRDIDVLDYLKAMVGTGTRIDVRFNHGYGGWEVKWSAGVIRWLLPQLVPYLVLKRRQAHLLLAFIAHNDSLVHGRELSDEEYAAKAAMYNESRRLNQKWSHKAEKRPVSTIELVQSVK